MKIELGDLKKLMGLNYDEFEKRFKVNGLEEGRITPEQYMELENLWSALVSGHTTPEEYFENNVEGTWIPTKGDPIKII